MPYIENKDNIRERIMIGKQKPTNPGELNYYMTTQILRYLADQRAMFGRLSYQTLNYVYGKLDEIYDNADKISLALDKERFVQNVQLVIRRYILDTDNVFSENGEHIMTDVRGAIRACQAEFYRRLIAPYEDQKIKENGDVYPVDNGAVLWSSYETKTGR
jgi:hypothetical protein